MAHDHPGHAHHTRHAQHEHAHGQATATSPRAFVLASIVNLTSTLVSPVRGLWTDSIAVLTDAVHDGGDCLVLGTAWYLQRVAMKGRDADYSYGYGRYSMLGGWLTSVVLIVGAVFMLVVSVPRLWAPELPDAEGM